MTNEIYDDIRYDDCRFPISFSVKKRVTEGDAHYVNRVMWHEEFEIKLFHSGAAVLLIGAQSIAAQAGDVVLCNPCEPHCMQQIVGSVEYDVAVFPVGLLENKFDKAEGMSLTAQLLSGKRKFLHLIRGNERIRTATGLLFSELCEESAYKQSAVMGVLTYLFSLLFALALYEETDRFTEAFSEKLRRITPSVEYINKNFGRELSLEAIAEKSALSPTYFSKYFKDVMGIGVSAYIKTVRLHNAEKLLRFTDEKISVIAEQCGFDDPCYFNRWFKEADGVTPGEFRKRKQ